MKRGGILVYADGTMRFLDYAPEGRWLIVPEEDRHGEMFERRFELHIAWQKPSEGGPGTAGTIVGTESSYTRVRY